MKQSFENHPAYQNEDLDVNTPKELEQARNMAGTTNNINAKRRALEEAKKINDMDLFLNTEKLLTDELKDRLANEGIVKKIKRALSPEHIAYKNDENDIETTKQFETAQKEAGIAKNSNELTKRELKFALQQNDDLLIENILKSKKNFSDFDFLCTIAEHAIKTKNEELFYKAFEKIKYNDENFEDESVFSNFYTEMEKTVKGQYKSKSYRPGGWVYTTREPFNDYCEKSYPSQKSKDEIQKEMPIYVKNFNNTIKILEAGKDVFDKDRIEMNIGIIRYRYLGGRQNFFSKDIALRNPFNETNKTTDHIINFSYWTEWAACFINTGNYRQTKEEWGQLAENIKNKVGEKNTILNIDLFNRFISKLNYKPSGEDTEEILDRLLGGADKAYRGVTYQYADLPFTEYSKNYEILFKFLKLTKTELSPEQKKIIVKSSLTESKIDSQSEQLPTVYKELGITDNIVEEVKYEIEEEVENNDEKNLQEVEIKEKDFEYHFEKAKPIIHEVGASINKAIRHCQFSEEDLIQLKSYLDELEKFKYKKAFKRMVINDVIEALRHSGEDGKHYYIISNKTESGVKRDGYKISYLDSPSYNKCPDCAGAENMSKFIQFLFKTGKNTERDIESKTIDAFKKIFGERSIIKGIKPKVNQWEEVSRTMSGNYVDDVVSMVKFNEDEI